MDTITATPLTTLSLVMISSSLILAVVVGGTVFLMRERRSKPAEAFLGSGARVQGAVVPAKSTEGASSWEEELTAKLDRLEDALSAFIDKLDIAGGSEEKPLVIHEKEPGREEILPMVAELRRKGLSSAGIAKKLGLSDEQVRLLLDIPVGNEA